MWPNKGEFGSKPERCAFVDMSFKISMHVARRSLFQKSDAHGEDQARPFFV
jgi:hypothetical protein